jgi:hypothetical protein
LILFIKLKLLNISITTKAATATPKTTSTKKSAGTTTEKTTEGNKRKFKSGRITKKNYTRKGS